MNYRIKSFINTLISYNFLLVTNKILSVIGSIILLRIIDVNSLGYATVLINIIGQSALISNLGLEIFAVREALKHEGNERTVFINILWYTRALLSIITVLAFTHITFTQKNELSNLIYISLLFIVFYNNINSDWVFQIYEKFKYQIYIQTIFLLTQIISFLLILKNNGYESYITCLGLASFASLITMFIIFKSRLGHNFLSKNSFIDFFKIKFFLNKYKKTIILSIAIYTLVHIQNNIEYILMSFLYSDKDIGYFKAATNYYGFIQSFAISLNFILLPKLCSILDKNELKTERQIKILVFFVSVIIATLMYYLSAYLISMLYGSTYKDAIIYAELYSLLIFVFSIYNMKTTNLIAESNYSKILKNLALCTAIYIISVFIFQKIGPSSFIISKMISYAFFIIIK